MRAAELSRNSPQLDHAQALQLATDLIKNARFSLHHVSLQTETCYYSHPSRPDSFLRVSTHKAKEGPIGLNGVVARLTISRREHITFKECDIVARTTFAVGRYFLTNPKQSKYVAVT